MNERKVVFSFIILQFASFESGLNSMEVGFTSVEVKYTYLHGSLMEVAGSIPWTLTRRRQ